ncbi:MAG TPA: hypothetical protein VF762_05325 [Blastocatellia bacterium]|jgi:hypothetical protein
MLNKFDLQREVSSLDVLISVLSSEIVREPRYCTPSGSPNELLREMEEALYELRQARGIRKILLTALENSCDMRVYKKQGAPALRRNNSPGHPSVCRL